MQDLRLPNRTQSAPRPAFAFLTSFHPKLLQPEKPTMPKVLVSDPIDQVGIDILSQVAQVEIKTNLSPEELVRAIPEYDALMIRSGTRVTKEVIEAGTQLKIIGRAGVGVDNVDVPAATRSGIVVVNSPEGNTIAAAEHALAMMLSLSRYIPDANRQVGPQEFRWRGGLQENPRHRGAGKDWLPCGGGGESDGHEAPRL
jgi:D-3-phosphoglycerate dehydrogenase